MPFETHELDSKIEGLRTEVSQQLSGMRAELKQMTELMRELVRLDGDMKRLSDAIGRIGKESEDHENRLRTLTETIATMQVHGAVNSKGVGSLERWLYIGGGALVSATVTYLVTRAAG